MRKPLQKIKLHKLHKMPKIYVIPGWGFQAEVFLKSELINAFDIIPLNYANQENYMTLLSTQIPQNSIVLGWSLGGLIAIKLAALFPSLVSKLILISSQARFLFDPSETHDIGIATKLFVTFMANLKHNLKEQTDMFLKLVNYPNRQKKVKNILANHFVKELVENEPQLSTLLSTDLSLEYSRIPVGILQIINLEDAIIKQDANYLKLLHPKTVITQIPKAGHAGFLTHGKMYQDIIMDFISS